MAYLLAPPETRARTPSCSPTTALFTDVTDTLSMVDFCKDAISSAEEVESIGDSSDDGSYTDKMRCDDDQIVIAKEITTPVRPAETGSPKITKPNAASTGKTANTKVNHTNTASSSKTASPKIPNANTTSSSKTVSQKVTQTNIPKTSSPPIHFISPKPRRTIHNDAALKNQSGASSPSREPGGSKKFADNSVHRNEYSSRRRSVGTASCSPQNLHWSPARDASRGDLPDVQARVLTVHQDWIHRGQARTQSNQSTGDRILKVPKNTRTVETEEETYQKAPVREGMPKQFPASEGPRPRIVLHKSSRRSSTVHGTSHHNIDASRTEEVPPRRPLHTKAPEKFRSRNHPYSSKAHGARSVFQSKTTIADAHIKAYPKYNDLSYDIPNVPSPKGNPVGALYRSNSSTADAHIKAYPKYNDLSYDIGPSGAAPSQGMYRSSSSSTNSFSCKAYPKYCDPADDIKMGQNPPPPRIAFHVPLRSAEPNRVVPTNGSKFGYRPRDIEHRTGFQDGMGLMIAKNPAERSQFMERFALPQQRRTHVSATRKLPLESKFRRAIR